MVIEQRLRNYVYFIAVMLVLVAFIAGIFLGNSIASNDLDTVSRFIRENELNSESYLVEQDLITDFDEENCDLAKKRMKDMSDELGRIGRSLSEEDIEEKLGKDNFNILKRQYHLMQVKTYTFFNRLVIDCNETVNIVLFFYGADDDSKKQGNSLDEIVEDYDARVFAVQYNYSRDLNFLESYYGIEETPSLVINFDNVEQGFRDYDELKNLLQAE